MSRGRRHAVCLALVVAGGAVAAPAAPAASGTSVRPTLLGTPSVRAVVVQERGRPPFLNLAVVFRTRRAIDRSRISTIAAPTLAREQTFPDELFGGITPGLVGDRSRHCYATEVTQIRPRTQLPADRTWAFALRRSGREGGIVSAIEHVRLRQDDTGGAWELQAARRLGC